MKDLLFFAGVASVLFGVWQIHQPAAFIVGGLVALWITIAIERDSVPRASDRVTRSDEGASE